jgi:hypothetical protein
MVLARADLEAGAVALEVYIYAKTEKRFRSWWAGG